MSIIKCFQFENLDHLVTEYQGFILSLFKLMDLHTKFTHQ